MLTSHQYFLSLPFTDFAATPLSLISVVSEPFLSLCSTTLLTTRHPTTQKLMDIVDSTIPGLAPTARDGAGFAEDEDARNLFAEEI